MSIPLRARRGKSLAIASAGIDAGSLFRQYSIAVSLESVIALSPERSAGDALSLT
jgi:hypothetical protein